MLKRCITICMVLICLFCLASPAFAIDELQLTEELLEGLFWSTSRSIGISGENINTVSNSTEVNSVGLSDIVDDYKSWFGLSEIEAIWDDIKGDIKDLGTVTYSNGREVTNMKIKVTTSNVNSLKQLGYSVQEYWKHKHNLYSSSNIDWVTINQLYGGYLSYGSSFSGVEVENTNSHWKIGSYGNYIQYGFITVGMDLYQHGNTEGTFYHLITFDDTNNTVKLLRNASYSGTSKSLIQNMVYLLYVQEITMSDSGNLVIALPDNGKTNANDYCYWYKITLMNQEQYNTFLNKTGNLVNSMSGIMSVNNGGSNNTTIVPGGHYYLVSALRVRFQNVNTVMNITNDIALTVNNNSYYARGRIFGVNRAATWNVDITDSGTGTNTTLEDALYTYFPSIYDDYTESPYIYFPSNVTYYPEVTDILTSDYPITGTIATTTSSTWPEGVQTEITPPASTGLSSIWYYVADTYAYCAIFFSNIWQVISVSFASTPIYKFAFVPIVLAIIFGMYRRFIE